jgi:hypothetical protein
MSFQYRKVKGKSHRNLGPNGKHTVIDYKDDHKENLHFWNRLDTDLVNATWKYPQPIGGIMRIGLALLGSNRVDPYPSGSRDKVRNWLSDYPRWVRYLAWHTIRNPWQDLLKYYLGFGYAFYNDRLWIAYYGKHDTEVWKDLIIGFYLAKFNWCPVKIPFPIIEIRPQPDVKLPVRFVFGYKKRGLGPTINLQRAD